MLLEPVDANTCGIYSQFIIVNEFFCIYISIGRVYHFEQVKCQYGEILTVSLNNSGGNNCYFKNLGPTVTWFFIHCEITRAFTIISDSIIDIVINQANLTLCVNVYSGLAHTKRNYSNEKL